MLRLIPSAIGGDWEKRTDVIHGILEKDTPFGHIAVRSGRESVLLWKNGHLF